MSGPISRVDANASYDPSQFDPPNENVCRPAVGPPAVLASPSSSPSSPPTTSNLPVDFPGSGVQLHKFRATGEVSWECMADCVSSQGLTVALDTVAVKAANQLPKAPGLPGAGVVALTNVVATTLACYVACSDLEALAPLPKPLEPAEVPDASVYSVGAP